MRIYWFLGFPIFFESFKFKFLFFFKKFFFLIFLFLIFFFFLIRRCVFWDLITIFILWKGKSKMHQLGGVSKEMGCDSFHDPFNKYLDLYILFFYAIFFTWLSLVLLYFHMIHKQFISKQKDVYLLGAFMTHNGFSRLCHEKVEQKCLKSK